MDIEKISQKGLEYKFLIKINKDQVDKKVFSFLQQKAKTYKLPGFRPGKVPLSVLKKSFGPDAYADFLYHEIRNGYNNVIKDNNIKPIREPQIKKIDDGDNTHQYEIIVEQTPEFKLEEFSKIKIKKLKAKLPKEQLDGFIKKLQKIHGDYKEVFRKAKKGDFVTFQYTVKDKEDKVVNEMKDIEDILEIDDKNEKRKGLMKKLIGCSKGDDFVLKLDGGDFYESLKGQELSVSYVINKVEECAPCELNETFYKKLDTSNFEELKEKLSGVLSHSTDRMTNMYLKRQLLDALNDTYTFEIQDSMVDDEKKTIERKIAEEEKHSGELDEKVTPDELDKLAQRRVRLGIIIGKIAEENKLSVSKEMLLGAMQQSAQSAGGDPAKVVKNWVKDPNVVSFFRMQLLEIVVIDFLLTKVSIDEKEVSVQELYKEVEEVLPDEVYDVA